MGRNLLEDTTKDGFKFSGHDGRYYLQLEHYNFENALSYCKLHSIKNIDFYWGNDLPIENFNFLEEFDFFEYISIHFDRKLDCNGIYHLKGLKGISITDNINNSIDLSFFNHLVECNVRWSEKLNIGKCIKLKTLVIEDLKSNDCNCISQLTNLQELELMNCRTLKSLNGIQNSEHLTHLELSMLSRLEDLSAVSSLKELSFLRIDSCKKTAKLNFLSKSRKLEVLQINECKQLESLAPLNELKQLQNVWIRNTKILDGDISPLLGRKEAYCTNFKNHSHTYQQLTGKG